MTGASTAARRILVLTDGKAGHENQSRACVRARGCECDLMPVRFKGKLAKALSYAADRLGVVSLGLLSGVEDVGAVAQRGYAAVVGTGSGTFYAAKALARRLGVRCGVVLYPRGYRISGFDCVLAQIQLDKRPLSPGTSREASGVPCLNPRRGLTLLSPVCRDPAIGV